MAVHSGKFAEWLAEGKGRYASDPIFQSMLSTSDLKQSAVEYTQKLLQDTSLFPDRPTDIITRDQLGKEKRENPLENATQGSKEDFQTKVKEFQLAAWHDACAKADAEYKKDDGTGETPAAIKLQFYREEMDALAKIDTSGRLKLAPNPYMHRAEMLADLEKRAIKMDGDFQKVKTNVEKIGAEIISTSEPPAKPIQSLTEATKIITNGPKDVPEDLKTKLEALNTGIEALKNKAADINNPSKQLELETKAVALQNQLSQINQDLNSEYTRNILRHAYKEKEDYEKLQQFLTSMQYLQGKIAAATPHAIGTPTKIDRNLYDKDPPSLLETTEYKSGSYGITYHENVEKDPRKEPKYEKRTLVDKDGNPIKLTDAEFDAATRLAVIEIKARMKKEGDLDGANNYDITYSSNWIGKGGTYHTGSEENAAIFKEKMKEVYEKRLAPAASAVSTTTLMPAAASGSVTGPTPASLVVEAPTGPTSR